jgi:pyrroloquinoline quinone (PQQ) biosynthesis protein C
MRWLKLHAHYDDAHPWEALDIIATLLGSKPEKKSVDDVRNSILTSFSYFKASLDCCL